MERGRGSVGVCEVVGGGVEGMKVGCAVCMRVASTVTVYKYVCACVCYVNMRPQLLANAHTHTSEHISTHISNTKYRVANSFCENSVNGHPVTTTLYYYNISWSIDD